MGVTGNFACGRATRFRGLSGFKKGENMKRFLMFIVLGLMMLGIVACGGDEEATPASIPTAMPTPIATAIAVATPTLPSTPTSVPVATEAAPEPEEIAVRMGDLYFGDSNDNTQNPPIWTVTSGAEVKVVAENRSGALQHNWAVVKLDETVPEPFLGDKQMEIVLLDTGVIDSGKSGAFTFTAPAAGEYQVICTVPGHYPSMQGKLVVKS
jgi:uncharacterized cupredoxin-like copper-binding protein